MGITFVKKEHALLWWNGKNTLTKLKHLLPMGLFQSNFVQIILWWREFKFFHKDHTILKTEIFFFFSQSKLWYNHWFFFLRKCVFDWNCFRGEWCGQWSFCLLQHLISTEMEGYVLVRWSEIVRLPTELTSFWERACLRPLTNIETSCVISVVSLLWTNLRNLAFEWRGCKNKTQVTKRSHAWEYLILISFDQYFIYCITHEFSWWCLQYRTSDKVKNYYSMYWPVHI